MVTVRPDSLFASHRRPPLGQSGLGSGCLIRWRYRVNLYFSGFTDSLSAGALHRRLGRRQLIGVCWSARPASRPSTRSGPICPSRAAAFLAAAAFFFPATLRRISCMGGAAGSEGEGEADTEGAGKSGSLGGLGLRVTSIAYPFPIAVPTPLANYPAQAPE